MASQSPSLQWGGRFSEAPDRALLEFGSSLREDLVLAPFDAQCSRAHVAALRSGGIITNVTAEALDDALAAVATEIESGAFAGYALRSGAEDIHGAIDARVRELAGDAGEWLHAGRSRNDQVATTLLLYTRDRAERGVRCTASIAHFALTSARRALGDGTVVAATTHWQPAQPVLLAFWLEAVAETFARSARRFRRVADDARESCPLGSGACCGSSLPLDRNASASLLGFAAPSRNALDSVGDRDAVLDLLHAAARAAVTASRVSEEIVIYCTPAFGYTRLADAASTGSSLMPQKRNPDPFELVRASGAAANGKLAAALGTLGGLALSYHRDLQSTKALAIDGIESVLASLAAFERAFTHVRWIAAAMEARASDGYVVATDVADALIASGVTARRAHALVGASVARAEAEARPLNATDLADLAAKANLDSLEAPLDARSSVRAKQTAGSTNPAMVARAIDELEAALERDFGSVPV